MPVPHFFKYASFAVQISKNALLGFSADRIYSRSSLLNFSAIPIFTSLMRSISTPTSQSETAAAAKEPLWEILKKAAPSA